jgi:hypothetical protein
MGVAAFAALIRPGGMQISSVDLAPQSYLKSREQIPLTEMLLSQLQFCLRVNCHAATSPQTRTKYKLQTGDNCYNSLRTMPNTNGYEPASFVAQEQTNRCRLPTP